MRRAMLWRIPPFWAAKTTIQWKELLLTPREMPTSLVALSRQPFPQHSAPTKASEQEIPTRFLQRSIPAAPLWLTPHISAAAELTAVVVSRSTLVAMLILQALPGRVIFLLRMHFRILLVEASMLLSRRSIRI